MFCKIAIFAATLLLMSCTPPLGPIDPTLSAVATAYEAGQPSTIPTPTAWPDRRLGQTVLGLRAAWRYHSGVPVNSNPPEPNIFIISNLVIVPTVANPADIFSNRFSNLTAVSLITGQVKWQTFYTSTENTGVDSATWDSQHLYLVYSSSVHAFDLGSGNLVWSTPELAGHTGYTFRPGDTLKPLQLHADSGKVIFIDPATGKVLGQREEGELIQHGSVDFVRSVNNLTAVDHASGKVLWSHTAKLPLQGQMQLWPSYVGDDVIFETGVLNYQIVRANVLTGAVTWQSTTDFTSNFAIDGGLIYALRQNNSLEILEANSGKELDEVTFSGPAPDLQLGYWVLTQYPYVVVYFGNTQELIAMKGKQ